MPSYAYNNPRLAKMWQERIRKINRMFKSLEQQDAMPHVRLAERA